MRCILQAKVPLDMHPPLILHLFPSMCSLLWIAASALMMIAASISRDADGAKQSLQALLRNGSKRCPSSLTS